MFDFNNVKSFDRHISLSIPSYDYLSRMIVGISQYWERKGNVIYDIGCSTGKHLKMMKGVSGCSYIGVDTSDMISESTDKIKFIKQNISNVDMCECDLVLSIFTLQFLTRKERKETIEKVKNSLRSGGAMIVAEKTFSEDGRVQSILDSIHKEFKSDNFSWEEIMNKEAQLRENMKPLTLSSLEKELSGIGRIFPIWRSFNFVCYLVLRD